MPFMCAIKQLFENKLQCLFNINKVFQYFNSVRRQLCSVYHNMLLRQRERLLHRLEVARDTGEHTRTPLADPTRTVKCYTRSAADVNMARPHLLRPFPVLYDTVRYLVLEVVSCTEVSTLCVYNFVADRLRAVRQDMIIQMLPPAESARLLEPMVRFHVLYGYKLCELPTSEYDPVLNKKQLQECLKSLLVCFDAMEHSKKYDDVEKLSRLCDEQLNIRRDSRTVLACDRILMETLYIMCNLEDVHPLLRYLNLPGKLRSSTVKVAYQISVENMRGNYVRACRLAMQLCPLSFYAFVTYLPAIQRKGLRVMNEAYYRSKQAFPTQKLREYLMFNSVQTASDICSHYGLQSDVRNVMFDKINFQKDACLLKPTKTLFERGPLIARNPFTTDYV